MAQQAITIKLTEETKRDYNSILDQINGETVSERFAKLLEFARKGMTQTTSGEGNAEQVTELENQIAELKSKLESVTASFTASQESYNTLNEKLLASEQECEKTSGKLSDALEENKQLKEQLESSATAGSEVEELRKQSIENANAANATQLKYEQAMESISKLTDENAQLKLERRDRKGDEAYMINDFTKAIVDATCKALVAKYPKRYEGLKPNHLLNHAILSYTVNRPAECLWPFVLGAGQLVKIASDINPDITTLSQLRKVLFHGK